MKIIKKWAVALIMLVASLASYGQGHVPTLGSNNVWTGTNTFNGGILLPALRSCTSPQVMAGFDTSFNPICVTVSGGGGSGVPSVNGITSAVTINNTDGKIQVTTDSAIHINCSGCLTTAVTTLGINGGAAVSGNATVEGDSNITVTLTGQNFQFHCPGCGSGGGSPGGGTGALQWNNGTSTFQGVVVTGMVKSSAAGPAQAIADTDFQLPFVITCGSGIACPKTGENYALSLTGSAGTGDVATGINGQLGGYLATGTTISGQPNVFAINPGWSALQTNGLFSRFSSMFVTSWSIGASTTTFTATNALNVGETVDMAYFPSNVNFFNNNFVTVTAASNTSFTVAGNFGQGVSSGTDEGWATFNVPPQPPTSQGTVIIPPGYPDDAAHQITNGGGISPAGQTIDTRLGYWFQQASGYGVSCSTASVFGTITAGQNFITVGSDAFAPTAAGMTVVTGQQSGAGMTMTQETWITHVDHYTFPYLYFTDNAPYNVSAFLYMGVDSQSALTRAQQEVQGSFPLYLPQCAMLTNTFRWTGSNIIGQQMNSTAITGFPGRDTFQQQDSLPVTAWAINATAGTTTFTIPWYSAHSPVIGDVVKLQSFAVPTFFNLQNVSIIAQPTPTTVTVNSAFGQGTSSGTDPGILASTTNVGTNAIRVENVAYGANNQIDPTYPWTEYIGSGSGVVQPPYYRPAMEFSVPMNDPRAPGWGLGIESVAQIAQNSGVICVPTTETALPVAGDTVVFPYQNATGAGAQTFTIASTAGACSTGWSPYTFGAYNGGPTTFPNNAAFTSPQAAFWIYHTAAPQSVGVPIPATITYPYNLYLNTPFPPISTNEANVAPHGTVVINGDEFEYMGDNFGGTASTPWVVTSVANASGGSTVYTGVFSGGFSCATPTPINMLGFTNASNNGTYMCTASTGTTATLTNPNGVSETAAATATSPAPTIVLRTGPTSINGGAGDAHGTVVSALNPCYGMKDNPWPVVPTINLTSITAWSVSSNVATFTAANRFYAGQIVRLTSPGGDDYAFNNLEVRVLSAGLSTTQFEAHVTMANGSGSTTMTADGGSTPVNATYYAGVCVGNAGIALPEADGNNTTFNGSGFSLGYFNNVEGGTPNDNDSNNSAWMWEQGNFTGYGNTFDNIRVVGTTFGLVQGPASVNQHGVRAVGPTSTGQTWKDCTFRTSYAFVIESMQQSNMDRCDTYSTEWSPYDHTIVGATTGLFIGNTLSEYDGGGVTGVNQFTVKDYNDEPENGDHEEFMPSVVSDGSNITWIGDIFEGGYNIFGGSYQHIIGTQLSNPVFNYGANNYFEHMYGLNTQIFKVVYDGSESFFDWGSFTSGDCSNSNGGGRQVMCSPNTVQTYNGHDAFATMFGNRVHPNANILGGMILPEEFGLAGAPVVFDSTEPWSGKHTECGLHPGSQCGYSSFDGFSGAIYIGPWQRITDAPTVLKTLMRVPTGSLSFSILLGAQDPGSGCSPNTSLAQGNFTITTAWTPVTLPVDFTGHAGCELSVVFFNAGSTNLIQTSYFNFVPFPGETYMPLATHTVGQACPVAGEFSVEKDFFWICKPSSGVTFGGGTWDYYGVPSVP